MPTLIRLVVILLVLVGLAYGGMFGLTLVVKPRERDVTIKIPARELVATPENAIVKRQIDTSKSSVPPADPAPAATAATPDATADAPADDAADAQSGDVVTKSQGVE